MMEKNLLQVRMLGGFSLQYGDKVIRDEENRSKKVWLLLAYCICHRNRPITGDELTALLWNDKDDINPQGALKTMFHRVRAFLDRLSPGLGHQLITHGRGSYGWNTEIPLWLDTDAFERLCGQAESARDATARLNKSLQAIALYQGDFLTKLSSEPWVVPIAAHYHQIYTRTALSALALLEEGERWDEVASLAQAVLQLEPFQEELYCRLMRVQLRQGDLRAAAATYEQMQALLFSGFGIMPSDESTALYRQALRSTNDHALSGVEVMQQLREQGVNQSGAYLCDYDFFKTIYRSMARSVPRTGVAVHLALISVTDEKGEALPRRSLERVIENLQQLALSHLRHGDVATRCSVSQLLLLLPQASYEDAQRVFSRLRKAFVHQYPHSPARLKVSILPLEPSQL